MAAIPTWSSNTRRVRGMTEQAPDLTPFEIRGNGWKKEIDAAHHVELTQILDKYFGEEDK